MRNSLLSRQTDTQVLWCVPTLTTKAIKAWVIDFYCNTNTTQYIFFGCQLDEPYGFPGDHQPDAAML